MRADVTSARPGGVEPAAGSRGGRARVALTLTDQLVSSASNFALSAMVARIGGASALGAFGVALLLWLAVVGVCRALVTEPMTVTGDLDVPVSEHRQGMAASIVVGLGAGLLLAAGSGVAAVAGLDVLGVLALVPWLPCLLAQDYCRGAAFRARRPHVALASDVVFAVVQAACTLLFAVAGVIDVAAFLAAWGLGALAGAVVGSVMLGVRPGLRGGLTKLRLLWPRSRWFLAEFGTAFPSDQGYLLLLPVLLGTAQFGLYRAASGLIGPVVVLFLAAGNVGLPDAVRSLREGGRSAVNRFTLRLTGVVVGVTAVYCGTVAVLAEPLLRLVYGEPFAPAATVTVLVAAQYVLYAVAFGAGVAMKAAGRLKELWVVRACTAVVTIASVAVLTSAGGLSGAGFAAVVAGGVYATGVLVAYFTVRPGADRRRRRGAHRLAAAAARERATSASGAVERADHPRRDPRHQRVRRDVRGHDGPGRDDGTRSDGHARQYRDVGAQPGT